MASVAGRKKSIISTNSLHIDTNSTNTLLNKSASQSTSLYQQCSALRSRLMRIKGFAQYFALSSNNPDARQSTDPVTQLWDLFSTGTPLCYIFDQLPPEQGFNKINHSQFVPEAYEANPGRAKKHAIALFAMQIRTDKVMQSIPGCELFTVTDLWDRNSTNGLVKVINTVTAIVDHLPPDIFENTPPSPPVSSANGSFDSLADTLVTQPADAKESARNNHIKELVETERKYVQDLEIMQKYATALAEQNLMDHDTIHLLFPGLNKLLNFQRKFLIRLESIAELPLQEQRWGLPFIENEDEFVVYEPYCANYPNALELMLTNEENLAPLNHMINVKGALPAMLIKPIQRICKYPLLLETVVKNASPSTYPHYQILKDGFDATKRITDKINEAQRRAENEQTVKSLQSRIDDWKGHHLENFGRLLLDDVFVVTKSDIDREYHVFLFEKIILCCKEALAQPSKPGKNAKQSAAILKKQPVPPPLNLPGANGQPQKNTPLLLKGRIFLGNVTKAVPAPVRVSSVTGVPTFHPLSVWWKGDDDLEFFTLRCRRDDQMRQWETTINRLIQDTARARNSRPGLSKIAQSAGAVMTTQHHRLANAPSIHSMSPSSTYSHSSQSSTATLRSRQGYPYSAYDDTSASSSSLGGFSSSYGGPQGYPPHDGFDMDPDDDDLEDYPVSATSSYPTSGRGTPVGARRTPSTHHSMPPERELITGYERPRAQTEGVDGPNMQQWRNGSGVPSMPSTASSSVQSPGGSLRPITPRMNSVMSATSYASDSSFGNGVPQQRPSLRTQYSSTRLRNGGYGSERDSTPNSTNPAPVPLPIPGVDYRGRSGTPTFSNGNGSNLAPPILNRSRSASQPTAYIPPVKAMPPPPLPSVPQPQSQSHWSRDVRAMNGAGGGSGTVPDRKRGSGSSQSTGGESSDYSPNSSSPITPFGSSESSLGGIRNSRSQTFDSVISGGDPTSPPVKVKVHFHEDIFVIQVPRSTEYGDLVEKVGRKIRLCGPRRDDGPLRVKYRDEDGDMVSLGSTEDVQMAFEQYRPGGQVTLFVT